MGLSKAIDSFIRRAHGDPVQVAKIAAEHRQNRKNKHKEVLLGPDYPGVPIDEILTARLNDPDYIDPRNNLCLFAWPSNEVTGLISRIQWELRMLAPNIWSSPPEWLHMTIIELVHSKSPAELETNAEKAKSHVARFTGFVAEHLAGLDRPTMNLDDTAVALTFPLVEDSWYTYFHLRRNLANICAESGMEVASKHYITSSHITFVRFVTSQI